jgi:hypothetical protein
MWPDRVFAGEVALPGWEARAKSLAARRTSKGGSGQQQRVRLGYAVSPADLAAFSASA